MNIFIDEVSAVVLDVGSRTTRAGFAGEDSPKAVFSTYYAVQNSDKPSLSPFTKTTKKDADNTTSDETNTNVDKDGDVNMEDNDTTKDNEEPKTVEDDERVSNSEKKSATEDSTTTPAKEETEKKDDNIKLRSANSEKDYKKYFIGDNSIHIPRADTEIKTPMKEGIVDDWDAMEHIWDHALNKVLAIEMDEHPLLITEHTWNTRQNRQKAMELAFEKVQVPAFYTVKSPVASIFASGKGSGLVVDIGHSIVSVTPVIDGLPLYKPSRRSLYAGDFLSQQVRHNLETQYTEKYPYLKTAVNTPRYLIASRKIPIEMGKPAQVILKKFPNAFVPGVPTQSFRDFEIYRVLDEFKESILQVSDTPFKAAEMEDSVIPRTFEFPDGSNYEFKNERFQISESLFKPKDFPYPGFPVPSSASATTEAVTSSLLPANKADEEEKEDEEKKEDGGGDSTAAVKEEKSTSHESIEPAASKEAPATTTGSTDSTSKDGAATSTTTTTSGAATSTGAAAPSSSTNTSSSSQQATPAYMLNDIRPVPPFSQTLGISELIVSSINACDVDARANLANNIVITGGSSLIQGLTDRINQDLSTMMPGLKIRLYAPGNLTERNYSAWVGGSILASLGTFHQLWISKREYDEVGPDKLLDRRFR